MKKSQGVTVIIGSEKLYFELNLEELYNAEKEKGYNALEQFLVYHKELNKRQTKRQCYKCLHSIGKNCIHVKSGIRK